ncbi:hypothetical protein [Bacillus sp. FJAT-45037]|uniref:hypothetical protein n=1 Tax=Bacillus sp. FJAT-45037 TaxID=2011007 RepID=UPI000C23F2E1|nr:hypothetical protein [Bacillus sp. FJAT-45037]
MSEQKRKEQPMDPFSQLMFGTPPEARQPQKEEPEKVPSQLEQILTIVQTLGPTLDKLAPLMGVVHTFFKQEPKNTNATSEKQEQVEEKSDNA